MDGIICQKQTTKQISASDKNKTKTLLQETKVVVNKSNALSLKQIKTESYS